MMKILAEVPFRLDPKIKSCLLKLATDGGRMRKNQREAFARNLSLICDGQYDRIFGMSNIDDDEMSLFVRDVT